MLNVTNKNYVLLEQTKYSKFSFLSNNIYDFPYILFFFSSHLGHNLQDIIYNKISLPFSIHVHSFIVILSTPSFVNWTGLYLCVCLCFMYINYLEVYRTYRLIPISKKLNREILLCVIQLAVLPLLCEGRMMSVNNTIFWQC